MMARRVRRKLRHCQGESEEVVGSNLEVPDVGCSRDIVGVPNWTSLQDDLVIHLLSRLSYRDRASLSSTCKQYRLLGSSPSLWDSLDLTCHMFDAETAISLSSRSKCLHKLRFRGASSADAIVHLQARELREIVGDCCSNINDATLSLIAARHEMLECLHLGPEACEKISSDAIRAIAFCCPRLRKLQLSGVKDVSRDAINSLSRHCEQLEEVAFMDSEVVDEEALGNLVSVRFLSVAGTKNLKWDVAIRSWSKLPRLVGLDVSRTNISLSSVMRLSDHLKVLLALDCPVFESEVGGQMSCNVKGKVVISVFSYIFEAVAALFVDTTRNEDVFCWRVVKYKQSSLEEILHWSEWVLSHVLLRTAETNPKEHDIFWMKQGIQLLIKLMTSSRNDVQERAVAAVATLMVADEENVVLDSWRKTLINESGIGVLLELVQSSQEGLQYEALKAVANLSLDQMVAKAVALDGGIDIFINLARSTNQLVAEEAAGGLWNLSVGEDHKVAIAEAGGIKALVDLIHKFPSGNIAVLERATGALANLAADKKCSMELELVGGIRALVTLAKSCKFEGVQEQICGHASRANTLSEDQPLSFFILAIQNAARALSNLATHGNINSSDASVGQETGALEALIQLTGSQNEGVRQEAAGALWNLSFDDKNREAIAAAGGVKALVALAQSCLNFSDCLQERAAGALWGLSVSEANSVAIGEEGGVAPLIALARSATAEVHETAVGALWNLAFNPGNALRIVESGGETALLNLCLSSASRLARFMAALALAYIYDQRVDELRFEGSSTETTRKSLNRSGFRRVVLKHIKLAILSFSDPQTITNAMVCSAPQSLDQFAKVLHIAEAGILRCSAAEIARLLSMLRNPNPTFKICSSFALLQFTMTGGRHTMHHVHLLQEAGAQRVLRAAAAATRATNETKVFAKLVLRNLELHRGGAPS